MSDGDDSWKRWYDVLAGLLIIGFGVILGVLAIVVGLAWRQKAW